MAGDQLGCWPVPRALRRRSFESVVAGGLPYLHVDAVNRTTRLLHIRFPVFLADIAIGNTLTVTSDVLAGSSVEGSLRDATVAVHGTTRLLALGLFTICLVLASWRRRSAALGGVRQRGDGASTLLDAVTPCA